MSSGPWGIRVLPSDLLKNQVVIQGAAMLLEMILAQTVG
jgi:hypothetical protein